MTAPLEQDPERRAARRVVEAAEEFYAAARAYGLDVDEAREQFYVPLSVRADAWCWRTSRLLLEPTYQRRQRRRKRWAA